ncbi:acetyl/propionyl/methylcrotonyl-CoA carboxylase subunit alpha [Alcaligenaceae bacterium LF4-65]|uniref:Acetyl/propionyl/methylcrotonyl-CoA carboxylase subunit alpha n=1 Tax=Zwartia hollandica TaxID=324606 RepID=A0A953N7C2_9BURK|nr:acetyl/propionyl/methylcrotonyl-CoA carboxylase subunit alpha [Zwartia hollandica]MBZ1349945.1 acetyl/propionyl/methylcrotonyl-CoA carboxylase subunit alpha [Zwartia hollandica]
MFTTLLIANRGEIACRVAATARRLGIKTIAVYSDADAESKHVAACDISVRLGPAPASESYLKADDILRVALAHGAQAIHPGYGFLSENEAFAHACAKAGICFVGPPASAIAAMGSKSAAKTLMEKAGVPLVPGYHGDEQAPEFLQQQADTMGYPVLIKASAGGGGKGMRIVTQAKDFIAALASCKREAAASFGDDKVLIERYLQKPRHIEIQVFSDTHKQHVYLFERDCSVQRRHQKVIEEAPAPGMTEARRQEMGEAAIAAARAVNYVGAGTVEFIAEPDGRFYFMEMNTRLQVEHPVTEMITGMDLVEWQLRVAAGERLPKTQDELQRCGHAIEARIYAENGDKDFLPSIGRLVHLEFPDHEAFINADVRVDGGVRAGDTISPYYDPMIAKLIVRGANRDQARARMLRALAATQIVGVHTNVAFLSRLMADEAFGEADLDTGLIERRRETLLPAPIPATREALLLACAAVLEQEKAVSALTTDPWAERCGWRVDGSYRRMLSFQDSESAQEVLIDMADGMTSLTVGAERVAVEISSQTNGVDSVLHVALLTRSSRVSGTVVRQGDRFDVFVSGKCETVTLKDPLASAGQAEADHAGSLTAPMPGKIIAIEVKAGEKVKRGQALLVMEAMKMEHTINAGVDGVVENVYFGVGEQVAEGAVLISLEQ